MRFSSRLTIGKEAVFVGREPVHAHEVHGDEWRDSGRWKISMQALDHYLDSHLSEHTFGSSIDGFVFCFEIADFERWGDLFKASADYTSYRPKRREVWSVGQLRWSEVKDLSAEKQLTALLSAIEQAILRVGIKRRKPKDFAHADFAAAVKALLETAPVEKLQAVPRAGAIV